MNGHELTFVIPTNRLRDVGEAVEEYDQRRGLPQRRVANQRFRSIRRPRHRQVHVVTRYVVDGQSSAIGQPALTPEVASEPPLGLAPPERTGRREVAARQT